MKEVVFSGGVSVPTLGQGTWYMGQDSSMRSTEADALRHGLDLGMTLIDTAEMYHDAELVVAEALRGRRDQAFVVSKVLPSNASLKGTITACERSLRKLAMDCLDLYLLHWPGPYPLEDTLEAFQRLVEQGKIRHYGVSNFDSDDMAAAWSMPGGEAIATNQVMYNLLERGIEWDLIPWCRQRGIPVMAYSPLNQGRLYPEVLEQIGQRHNANRHQVALAWVLQRDNVVAIPKAADIAHVNSNRAAADIILTTEELKQLDRAFPPPGGPSPLAII
jgi:diketogulonate reductase-like aldo/keto reductase